MSSKIINKIIVGDIGGTNSRFAIFSKNKDNQIRLENEIWQNTDDFNSFEDLLNSIKQKNDIYDITRYQNFVAAVPGPIISDDQLSFPNIKWDINKFKIYRLYPSVNIIFINDFIAQAYGCLTEASDNALSIIERNTTPQQQKDIAIIGAGTGTGHGALKNINGNTYIPLPSEAGHTLFPFITTSEFNFRKFLIKRGKIPVCDNVVSGPGLSLLHQYLTGKILPPSEVVSEISPNSETTEWFARFYARSCKNYCLTVLASGGKLFVSGGVAIKNPFLIDNDFFRYEFINCPTKVDLLKSISINLIMNNNIGLWGAAYFGLEAKK